MHIDRLTNPLAFFRCLGVTAALLALAAPSLGQAVGPLLISEQAILPHPGITLALDGDRLVTRSPATNSVAYFERTGGAWVLQQMLVVSGGDTITAAPRTTDIALRGDTLVVGVPHALGGEVYVSEFSGSGFGPFTSWQHLPIDHDYFGQAVLVHEGLVLVGAPDLNWSGVTSIYRRVAGVWQKVGTLPQMQDGGQGGLLRSHGNTLLVASLYAVTAMVEGATPVVWNQQGILYPASTVAPVAIDLDGDIAVVGSAGGSPSVPQAHVYERSGTTWSLAAALSVGGLPSNSGFGRAVAVEGETVWVGARGSGTSPGEVHVFRRLAAGWTHVATLRAAVPTAGGRFGASLDLDAGTLVVGASQTQGGVVFVYDVGTLPAPVTYCAAKINSQGCVPAIGSSGSAGATNPAAFTISATNVINQKTGLVLYSTGGPAATPFQGGTLCLAAPLRRTPAQSSGGNVGPDDCSGSYAFDFNALIDSAFDPALAPGAQVWAQYYSRDPADPFQVGLTNAITFTIGS